jgi:SHS2 domain-containing protein
MMVEDPGAIRPAQRRPVAVTGGSREGLLVAWLSELLYLYEVEGFLTARAAILRLTETELGAELSGEAFEPARHRVTGHVKAVTYHGLYITHDAAGYRAAIIVDV